MLLINLLNEFSYKAVFVKLLLLSFITFSEKLSHISFAIIYIDVPCSWSCCVMIMEHIHIQYIKIFSGPISPHYQLIYVEF